jgi:hypothetical protein
MDFVAKNTQPFRRKICPEFVAVTPRQYGTHLDTSSAKHRAWTRSLQTRGSAIFGGSVDPPFFAADLADPSGSNGIHEEIHFFRLH